MEANGGNGTSLSGNVVLGTGKGEAPAPEESAAHAAHGFRDLFLQHVRVHSPDKPRTVARYTAVLDHVKRILGAKMFVEAITRPDIDDYKVTRSAESSHQHPDRRITPRTINYEISVLRTFFYFLIHERNLAITNPCAKFKPLKDPRAESKAPAADLQRRRN